MDQKDLLLVPFPFSNQSGKKVRPVIVISNNGFNKNSEDLVVVGVTFNISKDLYTTNLTSNDLEDGKLFDECCIKVENILKIDKRLVVKRIGRINEEKFREIVSILNEIVKESG